jgi:hypothetical protein
MHGCSPFFREGAQTSPCRPVPVETSADDGIHRVPSQVRGQASESTQIMPHPWAASGEVANSAHAVRAGCWRGYLGRLLVVATGDADQNHRANHDSNATSRRTHHDNHHTTSASSLTRCSVIDCPV